METQPTTEKRQKADLNVKIELPNIEKPFFEKMSTEKNMISQVKKAGTKLGDTEKLNISVSGKTISLTKAETQSPTLNSNVQEKLNAEREINKGSDQKGNGTATVRQEKKSDAQEQPVSKTSNIENLDDAKKKNFDFVKDQIKFLGFGEDAGLHEKLEKHINSDAKEFSISTSSDKTSFQNKASFELHFNRSAETTNVFFNKFDARLTNEKRDVDLVHTFAVKNNGFTAKQAINLLEGRSVKTEITNPNTKEKETAFVKLKLNEEKNDNGNFKLQVYNKNYGVSTVNIVNNSNLVFKDDKHKEITIKSLEKGNIVAVRMKEKGKESEGKAILNPQYKTLNLYDMNMRRLNTTAPVLEETAQAGKEVKKQQYQSR